jgi:MFS family permease
MDQIDLLFVLAQIGVGVAGFASLATVIGQAYTRTDPEVNSIRLRGLLHISISVMLLSLLAIALLKIDGLSEEMAWRIASTVALVTAIICGIGVLRRDRTRRRLPGYNRLTMVINFSIMGIVVIELAISALGWSGRHAGSVYTGSLILMLVGCSTAFMLVVTSFLEGAPRKETPPPRTRP